MKICGNCGATFEETELIDNKCPECGSTDVDNAITCHRCEELIPEPCAHNYGEHKYCDECYFDLKG